MQHPISSVVVLLALAAGSSFATNPAIGSELSIENTEDPGSLLVTTNPSRYERLVVKSRLIDIAGPVRQVVPGIDASPQYRSEGVYQVRLPIDELVLRPTGHYLVVFDAYVNGIMPTEPPLHTRKETYVKITDTGMERIGASQFATETADTLHETHDRFAEYFGAQGMGGGGGDPVTNSEESECCTDPDPDIPEGPDVDVDGPGGDGGDDAGPGGEVPGGGETGGDDDWVPEDDPLFPIWDCWENGNCDDDEPDTEPRDTGETGETGGSGDTGSGPIGTGGPIDSGPAW